MIAVVVRGPSGALRIPTQPRRFVVWSDSGYLVGRPAGMGAPELPPLASSAWIVVGRINLPRDGRALTRGCVLRAVQRVV